ncbi:2-amino-4-hydroxy-6-hydroxymethyldihydropteridine diphosphokinase [Luteimonas deserti]|uniref:2-amino-4-hydroxy-6-hydroxymethyldihydropteridine pyrophosphokinase n=1 Tax=Luteimonas deserti TaxID=2752306 RepID=A0A7Z0U0Z3_9GAMM|nr:2-amino-4-hydroxy-6-hydroxymethyldihydropteridine diphosphokinase [Luteimonas deserti]NYZ63803.1 2-amino-4-hydroxy-6-hydroxymethyldihydropteridine diphosphokinase [Luteimonas deserti]
MSTAIHIGLGANLGDAAATVRDAACRLAREPVLDGVRCSRLYRTPAWGLTEQPDFVNAVVAAQTTLEAPAVLELLLRLERAFGRRRADDGRDRWGPRTLDLDLLLYGDARIELPQLTVPHPHLHVRAFALVPLLELDPDAVIPGVGRAADALARVDGDGVEALG